MIAVYRRVGFTLLVVGLFLTVTDTEIVVEPAEAVGVSDVTQPETIDTGGSGEIEATLDCRENTRLRRYR